jgi:hypothetical protein
MVNPNQSIYEDRLLRFREKQNQLQQSINIFGWIRLIVFLILAYIITGIIFPLKSPMLLLSSIFLGMIIFMVPLYYHQKLKDRLSFINSLVLINEF